MSDTFDPLTAAQDAFVSALATASGISAPVFQHVPAMQQPPFYVVGDLTAEPAGGKADALDLVTVEVAAVFRGSSRLGLLAMMSAVRTALVDREIVAAGHELSPPALLNAVAGGPVDETYEGILRFQTFVQPAD